MRKLIGLLLSLFLLCGCKADNRDVSTVMDLRTRLQKCQSCSFSATVTADYNTMVYKFTVDCVVNSEGDLTFTVMNPESISGITGVIGGKGGKLTFDGQMLAFDTLADGQISPVSAPWVMMKTLTGGYISAAGRDGEQIRGIFNDSYREQALELDIWFDESVLPKHCEILWQGRRVLSLDVDNFVIL